MSRSTQVSQLSAWEQCVAENMPHLSHCQARILAWWSFGIAMMQNCGRTTVAAFLALLLEEKEVNIERRLFEWCVDAKDKAGDKRQTLPVSASFAPLLGWVVRLWQGQTLVLSIDATYLNDRFVLLVVSVLFRGIGIPVAWVVQQGNKKGSWKPHWCRLLRLVRRQVPREWTVLVMADRGLHAAWLYRRIRRLGWHPFLRVNSGAMFRPAGKANWQWLKSLVSQPGQSWQGHGHLSKSAPLDCTLLACWQPPYDEHWFIITDLEPDACCASWYQLRAWCEQGFKCTKRGGWKWQHTRMTDPQRVERIWLALAVAMLWVVAIGAAAEQPTPTADADTMDWAALLSSKPAKRRLRLFRRGCILLIVAAIRGTPFPLPTALIPEPLPLPFPARSSPEMTLVT